MDGLPAFPTALKPLVRSFDITQRSRDRLSLGNFSRVGRDQVAVPLRALVNNALKEGAECCSTCGPAV